MWQLQERYVKRLVCPVRLADDHRSRAAPHRAGRRAQRRRLGGRCWRWPKRRPSARRCTPWATPHPMAAERRVPLHRALHVARLALLVLGAVATANAVAWWTRPWVEALATLVVGTLLLFIVGDALPRSVARIAPELSEAGAAARAPDARARSVRCSWLLAWADRGLHSTWSERRARCNHPSASRSATCCSASSPWPTPRSTRS